MQQISTADKAAFGPGGVDMAEHLVQQSGVRDGLERRGGRGAG